MSVVKRVKVYYSSFPIQVKASLWFLVCSFLQKGISSLTIPIFTRLLSTTEFGQYNVFNSWLGIATVFITLQLSAGVYTQGLIKFDKDRDIFSSSLQGLLLLLVCCWTIVYLSFLRFWNSLLNLSTVQVLAMLVMIWATAVFNLWSAEQRVDYLYKKLVKLTLISSLLKPLVSYIFVVLADDKATAWILALALVELVCFSALFVIQAKRGKQLFSKKYWIYALSFNLPLVPHYLSQQVLNSADRIMIQRLVGLSEAGIYGLAYSISLIMTLFNTALVQTLSPWIFQKIKDKKAKEISGVSYICLIIIAVLNLLLIAFAPEVVALFAPKSYYSAIWIIPPVSMSVVFMFSYDLFAKFQFYYEKTIYVMIASLLGAFLNIILNLYFIKQYGYYAAAYTTLFCYCFYAFLHYCYMRKVCNDYLDGLVVFSPIVLLVIYGVFFILSVLLMLTYPHPFIRYPIICFAIIVAIWKRNIIKSAITTVLNIRKTNNN